MADAYDFELAELKVTLRHYQEQLKHFDTCKRELASARAAYSTLWNELQALRPATEQLVRENAALRRAMIDHEWFATIVPALMAGAGELQREAQSA